MKIYTFCAPKGGVGKTSLAYNYGEWLADRGHRVLLIDSDHQCSLTQTYGIYTENNTLAEIFLPGDSSVEILKLNKNLDLIPCSLKLDKVNNEIQTKTNKDMLFFMWLLDYSDANPSFNEYDYVVIDCHPDFSTITKNMIAVSDFIISPVEPSEYSYTSKANLDVRFKEFQRELIDPIKRTSYITAELYFIANKIKHNTKSSRDFIEQFMKDDHILDIVIPEKELINKSVLDRRPVHALMKDPTIFRKHRAFFESIQESFEKLEEL